MALVAMGLGVLVIANDFTALNVALPSIEHDLDTDVGTTQWVINAYALTFGMAIVTGGKLADMFGRRRVFFIGSVIFAVFSLAGGFAPNTGLLIAARVGMGIGAALMWPAILGMTFAALPESKAGLAGGLILGAAGIGNAMGPLIGGALSDLASWRWIFFLNVPIAALAILVTYLKVHQPPVEVDERRIDYGGIATLSLALVFLLVGMDQAADWGWGDPRVVGLFIAAVLLAVAFAFVEPRMKAAALVPGDIIRNRPFTAACMATLLMSAVFFTTVLYAPQLMQKILGYSAAAVGGRDAADARRLRRDLVRRRPALQPARRQDSGHRRLGRARGRPLSALAIRRRLGLRRPGAGPGDHRPRRRPLLSLGDHRRGHRAGSVPLEPRRRHRLHVPDRRRGGRASGWRRRSSPPPRRARSPTTRSSRGCI